MPSRQLLSQSASSSKQQQSISHFFTKGSPAALTSLSLVPQRASTSVSKQGTDLPGAQENEGLFVESQDNSPASRPTPKRKLDEDEEPAELEACGDISGLSGYKKPRRLNSQVQGNSNIGESTDFPTNECDTYSSEKSRESLHTAANGTKDPKASSRTSRYLFSSSPMLNDQTDENDEEARRRKERLHQKFVKKLGRPDSIAEIKRRNWRGPEDDNQEGSNDEADLDEDEPPAKTATKKGVASKKNGSKLTPMEKQVLEIKRQHTDTILVVEVGYKFRFFGEDARVAAKELSIVCIPGKFRYDEHPSEAHLNRFASASIPVHRLHVHVKRLVAAGHKVGVVRQLETAALKAVGENRNAPFVRKLTNLYTKGTYIDDVEGLEGLVDGPVGGAPATGYLLCVTENRSNGWGTDEKVQVGMVAVQPATGDVIYDDFEDGFMRSEIETRLLHIAPCEFLIVGTLSKATEKLVQHLSGSKTNVFGDRIRVENVERPKTMTAEAYSHVSNFYAGKMKASNLEEDAKASALLDKVLKLPENVTVCLSAMITHMSDYGLEHVFDLTKYFQSFSARSHMLLNGTTLMSLEIYQNQTDHTGKGSLFWTLNRTQTRFGHRLLRKWVGRPLLDRLKLEERIAAVEELKDGDTNIVVDKIKRLLSKIKSDLEKSLIRIYYGKVSGRDFQHDLD